MASSLLRTTPALRAGLRARAAKPLAAMASTSFVRGKATLPDLPCKPPIPLSPIPSSRQRNNNMTSPQYSQTRMNTITR